MLARATGSLKWAQQRPPGLGAGSGVPLAGDRDN
jgi:hypothetical protein